MKTIQVYGPGCEKCNKLATATHEALLELQVNIPVEKVTDMLKFPSAKVLITPALVIDGEILLSGKVPSKDAIKALLLKTQNKIEFPPHCSCEEKCGEQTNTPHSDSMNANNIANKTKGKKLKKTVLWISAILILLAIIKTINHRDQAGIAHESNKTNQHLKPDHIAVIYYQYGARCVTCVKMEQWSKEAIQQNFQTELNNGSLIFQSIPANQESVAKYALTSKSLIIKEMRKDKETTWSNLEQIWDLNNDEQAFKTYVTQTVREILNKLPSSRL